MSSQQNMEVTLTGHPIRSQHLMALSYGRVFGPHGRIFHPIHLLKWEMGQPSSSGRKDTWLGNSPLKETFPNIFLIAANEDSSIPHNRENNTWKPLLRRHLQDWEVEDLMTLGELYSEQSQCRQAEVGQLKRRIILNQGYALMCSSKTMIDLWPWRLVWRTWLPTKVMCFSWTVLKGACLTQDNLSRRKIQLVNSYHMCHSSLESIHHLFIHRPVATDIWYMSLTLSGLLWAMRYKVWEVYEAWGVEKVEKAVKKIWIMVPACIFWC